MENRIPGMNTTWAPQGAWICKERVTKVHILSVSSSGLINDGDEMTHLSPATENHSAQLVQSINKLLTSSNLCTISYIRLTSHSTYINKMTAQLIQHSIQLRSQSNFRQTQVRASQLNKSPFEKDQSVYSCLSQRKFADKINGLTMG